MNILRMFVASFVALIGFGLQAVTFRPQFSKADSSVEYIKMAAPASGDRCGSLTIKPKAGYNVLIQSTIWSGYKNTERVLSKYSGRITPNDVADATFVRLLPMGVQARFDWGGRSAQTHYRIYCFTRDVVGQFPTPVDCSKVVDISKIVFDVICGITNPVPYGDLNMNEG